MNYFLKVWITPRIYLSVVDELVIAGELIFVSLIVATVVYFCSKKKWLPDAHRPARPARLI